MNKKLFYFLIILFSLSSFLLINSVYATGILPDGGRIKSGDYSLNDLIRLLLNASNIIFLLVGSISLLMFVYGGFMFLISSGNSEMIGKGRNAIISSIVGIIIVFGSFTVVDFTMKGLGYNEKKFGLWYETLEETKVAAPRPPTGATGAALDTTDWKFDPGIIKQVNDASPELSSLLNCMRGRLPAGVGQISSISDNNHIGNLSTCNNAYTYTNKCDSNGLPAGCCWHSPSSCHYGGGSNMGKSLAVDFGDEYNKSSLVKAINDCGGANILDEGSHIHVSVKECKLDKY